MCEKEREREAKRGKGLSTCSGRLRNREGGEGEGEGEGLGVGDEFLEAPQALIGLEDGLGLLGQLTHSLPDSLHVLPQHLDPT